jgi:hypothetical protein
LLSQTTDINFEIPFSPEGPLESLRKLTFSELLNDRNQGPIIIVVPGARGRGLRLIVEAASREKHPRYQRLQQVPHGPNPADTCRSRTKKNCDKHAETTITPDCARSPPLHHGRRLLRVTPLNRFWYSRHHTVGNGGSIGQRAPRVSSSNPHTRSARRPSVCLIAPLPNGQSSPARLMEGAVKAWFSTKNSVTPLVQPASKTRYTCESRNAIATKWC